MCIKAGIIITNGRRRQWGDDVTARGRKSKHFVDLLDIPIWLGGGARRELYMNIWWVCANLKVWQRRENYSPRCSAKIESLWKKEFCRRSSGDSFTLSDNGHLECERAFWLWAKKMNPHPTYASSDFTTSIIFSRRAVAAKPRSSKQAKEGQGHIHS